MASSTLKSNFYKWHRILGLTALVPVIFWTLSGLSHPFMANWFRPVIANEVFNPLPQSQMKPELTIQQVLDRNHINKLRNFGIINFNKGTYYQVLDKDSVYNYYSAKDGVLLPHGDIDYAMYLARYFTQDNTSALKSVLLQKGFDTQYQSINHLLPVYKVSFDRPDGMDIYIETGQSRMATFNNNTRKTFLWIFEQFHTWQFLADIGGDTFRNIVLLFIMGVMFLALLSGLIVYGLLWKKFKVISQKRKADNVEDKRFTHRFHRQIGLIVSLVLFTFVISGAFHIAVKLHNVEPVTADYRQLISMSLLTVSNFSIPISDSTVKKIGLVSYNDSVYYQVTDKSKLIHYYNTQSGKEQINADEDYARFLSNYYHTAESALNTFKGRVKVDMIKQFDNDYGFINKRLPVERVNYPNGDNWYIETTTSKLAAKVTGIDRAEGLSFIFLHKYFGMTWAGKDMRDIVSMLSALGVLVVSLFGFVSFIKNK